MSGIDSANQYRVQGGQFFSLKEIPSMRLTKAQLDEAAEYEKQQQAYLDSIDRYAEQNPAKIYGQVVVNGEVFATVYDNGSMASSYNAGLRLTDGPAGMELAKARLNEISQQMHGEIKYTDFVGGHGGGSVVIPDSIPRPTARSIYEIVSGLCEDYMRSQVAAAAEKIE